MQVCNAVEAPMTEQKNSTDGHEDELWIAGLFGICGVVVTAFMMFVAFYPEGGRLVSNAAEAEFLLTQPSPVPAEMALPQQPARLARR
jgi:hypothetical protein